MRPDAQELDLGNLTSILEWARWGARHIDQIGPIMDEFSKIAEQPGPGFKSKWEQVKVCGDLVVPILDDCPLVKPMVVGADAPQSLTQEQFDAELAALCNSVDHSHGSIEPPVVAFGADAPRPVGRGELLRMLIENLPQIASFIATLVELFGA